VREQHHLLHAQQLLADLGFPLADVQPRAGDFSLADADLIPRFLRLEGFGVLPDPSLPRLSAYLKRVKERPSVKAIS
jgi:glutathione S-transferase